MKSGLLTFLLILALSSSSHNICACTTHCFDGPDGAIYGANLDLFIPADGLVFINKRGIEKRGFNPSATGEIIEWTSRYGSVTFNLAGKEWALGGMNEAGLVLGSMEILSSAFPATDARPPLPISPWAQYVLDTCTTIDEVIKVDQKVRIEDIAPPIHFLVADASGACAAIEWFDGEFVCHSGQKLQARAMTNMPYQMALEAFQSGGPKWWMWWLWFSNPGQSAERFANACKRGIDYNSESEPNAIRYAFETLTQFVAAPHTKWNIVYDIGNQKVYYRTVRSPAVKSIAFRDLDFTCASPLMVLDVNAPLQGNVAGNFQPYDSEVNRKLLRNLCNRLNLNVKESDIQIVTETVDSFACY